MKKAFLLFMATFVLTTATAQVKCGWKSWNKAGTETKMLGPIESDYSEEEMEFLSDPTLRIVDDKEFEHYKTALHNYFREVNNFLDDDENFKRFPSHIYYMKEYQRLNRKALDRMEKDEWFWPLYKSHMNPVSSYTREYNDDIEHKAFENGNKLP